MTEWGCTMQCVVGLNGMMLRFLPTSATCDDIQPVVERLDSFSHHLTPVLEDGASHDAALQRSLHQHRSLPS
jgi:hypothetical protein